MSSAMWCCVVSLSSFPLFSSSSSSSSCSHHSVFLFFFQTRSSSMVSLESFARREATADEAAADEAAAGRRQKSKGRRRILGGLHCQRCLKRTKKGVRVAFVTSPPLVAAYAGFAACGLRAVFGVVLRAAASSSISLQYRKRGAHVVNTSHTHKRQY